MAEDSDPASRPSAPLVAAASEAAQAATPDLARDAETASQEPARAGIAGLCRVAPAQAGAIVERDRSGAVRPLTIHRTATTEALPSDWLTTCGDSLQRALATGEVAVRPVRAPQDLYGQAPRYQVIVFPLTCCGWPDRCLALLLSAQPAGGLSSAQERVEVALPLLRMGDLQASLASQAEVAERLSTAVEVLAAIQRHERFLPAALSLCNEVATRWHCTRTGLGVLRGRYVELRAVSHSESFSRKTKLVVAIEAAMEECLDQDTEISCPSPPDATWIDRAHRDLTTSYGPSVVVSLPLRLDDEPRAAFTAERPSDRPIEGRDLLALRLTLALCAPTLIRLSESDRWIGARAASAARRFGATIVGARHTGAKLIALACLAALLVLVFGHGTHRVDAPFVLKAETQRVLPAPFDGYLESVCVEPGSTVAAGTTVLATLSPVELRLQLAAAKAEQAAYLKEASAKMSGQDTAEEQVARAQADKLAARVNLLEQELNQSRILSPIDGAVVAGDLKEKVGAPVRQGDVLFEVAALDSLYATAFISDEEIGYVLAGQQGDLAAAAFPTRRIGVVVERIEPIAEVVDRRNVFKVRLRLLSRPDWMRPGMEGLSRVEIGRRTYGWIVFHRFVDWLRMALWW